MSSPAGGLGGYAVEEGGEDVVGDHAAAEGELPVAVVLGEEAVADELFGGFADGGEEAGGGLRAEGCDVEAGVRAEAEEDGFFEGFVRPDGGYDLGRCGGVVGEELVGVGEADGGVGCVVAEEHGVGVEAEAEVGGAVPVLEVVARLMRGACEVGDLVLREAVLREPVAGGFVELGGEVVGGGGVGVEALAAGEDFAAKAGVFVDLEHVDAEVGEADGGRDF